MPRAKTPPKKSRRPAAKPAKTPAKTPSVRRRTMPGKEKDRAPARKPGRALKDRSKARDQQEPVVRYVFIPPASGVKMNEHTTLRVGTAWACVRYISETLASLDWPTYELQSLGDKTLRIYDSSHPVDWLLDFEANPEMSSFTFREVLLAWANTWGNGYAEIERDLSGRPANLWPLNPARVNPTRTNAGELVYDVDNGGGQPNTILYPGDVFHLKGLSWDGILGHNVARLASETLGLGLATEKFAASFFGNGAMPEGVLTTDEVLDQPAADRIKATWRQRHGGPNKQRGVAVLENGLKFQATGVDPDKGQLNQTQMSMIEHLCRWWRVPPQKVGHLVKASYASVEETSREAIIDCLFPWARRLECEAQRKLFGRKQKGRYVTVHDFSVMNRGDLITQTNHAVAMMEHGLFDVDEGRAYFDLNPIGKDRGGDKRMVPTNYTTLENLGKVVPGAGQSGKEGGQSGSKMPKKKSNSVLMPDEGKLLGSFLPVLTEAFGRCQTRARQRSADALKKFSGDPIGFDGWLNHFLADHHSYAEKALLPAGRSLVALAGHGDAEFALTGFLQRYAAELRAVLTDAFAGGKTPELNGEAESAKSVARLCLTTGEH